MATPQIQVLLDGTELGSEVEQALAHVGAEFVVGDFGASEVSYAPGPFDARLVVSAGDWPESDGRRSRLDNWLERDPCATLVLSATKPAKDVFPHTTASGYPVDFAAGMSEGELAGRLSAMCSLRGHMLALKKNLATVKKQEETLKTRVSELNEDLRLAADLQRDLLPSSLPVVENLDIDVIYKPVGMISGDLYNVVRLDTERVAISLVDATGHGVPAAILAAFVERSLSGRGTDRGQGQAVEPDDVLRRLNDELSDMQLQECYFVAGLFAIYDEGTRVLRWARGGAPYPILIRKGEQPRGMKSEGPLVGVNRNARFEVAEIVLDPGDVVMFHTDGLDALFTDPTDGNGKATLEGTSWFRALGQGDIQQHLAEVNDKLTASNSDNPRSDDVTLLTLRVNDPA